jgi:hypothetical protein
MPPRVLPLPLLCSVLVVVLVLVHEDLQCRRRRAARHYLTRLSLPPLCRSAWRSVLESSDARGLLDTTGFNRATFNHLLSLFAPLWLTQRRRRTQLHAEDVLGLVLQYLNTSARQKTLCQIFALPPSTLCRHLRRGLAVLLAAVRHDHDSRIAWPTAAEMQHLSGLMSCYAPALTNIFGFVDGVYFRCDDPADSETQNAYYNAWKSCCSITNVLVFATDGTIIWARYNLPGSWHDSRLARPLYTRLIDPVRTPGQFALVADTAFPRKDPQLRRKIITPLKVGDAYDANVSIASQVAYNSEVVRARQGVEWGMHSLQSTFGRLHAPLPFDPPYTACLLKLIFHIFNLRVRRVQLNQIRTVYCGPPS